MNMTNNTGSTLTTSGNSGYGLFANLGSNITSTGLLTINTGGENAYGIYANNASTIEVSDATINTGGDYANGIYANNASTIEVNDATINTTGIGSYGLVSEGNSSKIISNGPLIISTQGGGSHGVSAINFGEIELTNVNIETLGDYASGISADRISSIEASNATINTTGVEAHGIFAYRRAAVEVSNATINTTGVEAHGIFADYESTIKATDATIKTTGLNAHAVIANNLGLIELSQLGGEMTSIQGTSLYSEGGKIDATLDGVQIINNGLLINARTTDLYNEPGVVNLVAKNLTMNGDVRADYASIADLTLENASWSGNATNGNNFSINNKSIWTLSTDSDVANLNNAGTILFSAPADGINPPAWSGRTLTIHNQYAANDGVLQLNTVLGNDQSITDRLVVEGDTTGTTSLYIMNQNGNGAFTQNGINVVQVDGISAGKFNLANTVVAGAYEYKLVNKKLLNGTSSGWYLTSKLSDLKPIDPQPPIDPESPIDPVLPIWGGGIVAPDTPIYRADAGINLSNQQGVIYSMIPGLGNNTTSAIGAGSSGSMRAASRLSASGDTTGNTGIVTPQKSNSLWSFVSVNRTTGHTGKGQIDYSADTSSLQIGTHTSFDIGEGLIQAGIMGAYGRITTDSQNILTRSTGTGRVTGYSIGLYGTWYANKDSIMSPYIDAYLTHGWYNNEVSTKGNLAAKYRSNATSITVQAGYPLAFGANIIVEPQAQITYLHYNSRDYSDHTNTRVSNELKGNTVGRIGTYLYANNNRFKPYVAMNVWYDNTNSIVKYNGVEMSSDKKGAIMEAKIGFQAQATPDLTFWGEVGIRKGKHNFQDVGGSVGLKYRF